MWGIHHVLYSIAEQNAAIDLSLNLPLLLKIACAGALFGIAGLVFAEANHTLGGFLKRIVPYGPARPFIGGLAVIGLVYLFGTRDYLGLGVWSADPQGLTISSFFDGPVDHWSWALKMLFTVVTLSAGFKGGEVTPLFFIGAPLGNALAWVVGAPVDLFAAIGFVAVFAGATNTPLACTIMGIELFGAEPMVPIAIACFMAYLCSGHSGIYLSQRIAIPKAPDSLLPPETNLRDARAIRPRASLSNIFPTPHSGDPEGMSYPHEVTPAEIGMIRIYMKPSDKAPKKAGGRRSGLFGTKPLYRELVSQAKSDGIMNAIAHHTHYGFSNNESIGQDGFELSNPHLTMCVELIGQRPELETFCRRHGELLADKVIVYKHLEHWSVGTAGVHSEQVTPVESPVPA